MPETPYGDIFTIWICSESLGLYLYGFDARHQWASSFTHFCTSCIWFALNKLSFLFAYREDGQIFIF